MEKFYSLKGIDKNIFNQVDIDEKNKSFDNFVYKKRLIFNSQILFNLIESSERDLVNFVAKIIESKYKDDSEENLKKIWNLFSEKIDYLFFLHKGSIDFDKIILKFDIENNKNLFSEFDNLIVNYNDVSFITFKNIINIASSLNERFKNNNKENEFIFKENILKIEKFIRENFFESEEKFYKDKKYLFILKLIFENKLNLDLNLNDFRLCLNNHNYYYNTSLVDYLDLNFFLKMDKFNYNYEEKNELWLYFVEYIIDFISDNSKTDKEKHDYINKFIDKFIYDDIDKLLEFLNNYYDNNSVFYIKIVDQIKYIYKNNKNYLENYLNKYNLDWVFYQK